MYNEGYTLVLWTSRNEEYFTECKRYLAENGLLKYFTPLEDCGRRIGTTGKLEANYYIDDKSLFGTELNWNSIYDYITDHSVLKVTNTGLTAETITLE